MSELIFHIPTFKKKKQSLVCNEEKAYICEWQPPSAGKHSEGRRAEITKLVFYSFLSWFGVDNTVIQFLVF